MSYILPHLDNGWEVDQAIINETDKLVVIRFGHDWDTQCMQMEISFKVKIERKRFFFCERTA